LQESAHCSGGDVLSTLGGELGGVEYDFFAVISRAAKRGHTPEEIDRAYEAALTQAFNKPGKGRPLGSREKGKNIEHHLMNMRQILISDPGMRVLTAAKEALKDVPARERPRPEYLARTFRGDENGTLIVDFLRALKKLSNFVPHTGPTADFERLLIELTRILDDRYSSRSIGKYWSSRNFKRFGAKLKALEAAYLD
jgi:hypothetical protein